MSGRDAWEQTFDLLDEWNAAHEAAIDECLYCSHRAVLGTWLCPECIHEYSEVERIEKALKVEWT